MSLNKPHADRMIYHVSKSTMIFSKKFGTNRLLPESDLSQQPF